MIIGLLKLALVEDRVRAPHTLFYGNKGSGKTSLIADFINEEYQRAGRLVVYDIHLTMNESNLEDEIYKRYPSLKDALDVVVVKPRVVDLHRNGSGVVRIEAFHKFLSLLDSDQRSLVYVREPQRMLIDNATRSKMFRLPELLEDRNCRLVFEQRSSGEKKLMVDVHTLITQSQILTYTKDGKYSMENRSTVEGKRWLGSDSDLRMGDDGMFIDNAFMSYLESGTGEKDDK